MKNKIIALLILLLALSVGGSIYTVKGQIDNSSQLENDRAYYDYRAKVREEEIERNSMCTEVVANHQLLMENEIDPKLDCADKNLKMEKGEVRENCEQSYRSFIKAK